jgi:hypothetical protein
MVLFSTHHRNLSDSDDSGLMNKRNGQSRRGGQQTGLKSGKIADAVLWWRMGGEKPRGNCLKWPAKQSPWSRSAAGHIPF